MERTDTRIFPGRRQGSTAADSAGGDLSNVPADPPVMLDTYSRAP
ncbi:hypothetical protein RE9414_27850 [Prescottella equi]|nr:hypothetical protein RE9414_27850 [Prescottella equi]